MSQSRFCRWSSVWRHSDNNSAAKRALRLHHVDNYLKKILAFVYHGSIVNNRPKTRLFTLCTYISFNGQSLRLFKRRSRLKIRANIFSKGIVDSWTLNRWRSKCTLPKQFQESAQPFLAWTPVQVQSILLRIGTTYNWSASSLPECISCNANSDNSYLSSIFFQIYF